MLRKYSDDNIDVNNDVNLELICLFCCLVIARTGISRLMLMINVASVFM